MTTKDPMTTDGNWQRHYHSSSSAQTQAFAAQLGTILEAGDLLVLSGELGAGKTTFTQGLGEGLGVRPGIISPTFVLVRVHPNLADGPRPGGPDLVHVDAYRLASAAEIDDIDLENTMDSAVTVVEWGQDRVEHLAASRLEIHLQRAGGGEAADPRVWDFDPEDDDEPREIWLTAIGPRWESGRGREHLEALNFNETLAPRTVAEGPE